MFGGSRRFREDNCSANLREIKLSEIRFDVGFLHITIFGYRKLKSHGTSNNIAYESDTEALEKEKEVELTIINYFHS